jgi:DJ-1 family protein
MEIKALIPFANGSEELEMITVSNLFRRAGYKVTVAGETELVTGARGTKIIPDVLIDNIATDDDFDVIVLPGGTLGVNRFASNSYLEKIVKNHYQKHRLTGAICAAPLALKSYDLLKKETKLTSFPSVENELSNFDYKQDDVVIDSHLVTSRGVGTSIEFALKLIEIISGKEKSISVAKEIVYNV